MFDSATYVDSFGHLATDVEYLPFNVRNGEKCYPVLRFVTQEKIARALNKFVQTRICEDSGYNISLAELVLSDRGGGRFLYSIEIIPDRRIRNLEEIEQQFRRTLGTLRKSIREFRVKNPSKHRLR